MVAVNVFWQRPQNYYDQDSWRGTWEFDGGALMNQASHYVDLLDWLVGPVESVSASIATLGRAVRWKIRRPCSCAGAAALGTMAVTMLTCPKNLEGSITLLGEAGTVKVGGPAVNQIEHWAFADESPDDAEVKQAFTSPPVCIALVPLLRQCAGCPSGKGCSSMRRSRGPAKPGAADRRLPFGAGWTPGAPPGVLSS